MADVSTMTDVSRRFLQDSRDFLAGDYMPKIERCVAALTEGQVWARVNDASNSIGNLILHLDGSSRYWAVEVIGGTPIGRVRQREFDERGPIPTKRLLVDLRRAMEEVDRVLENLAPEKLLESRTARGEQVTVLWSVYHIVEHFGMHTGQILTMTKAIVGEFRIDD
jgi:uncharacterized damage-inducible protein DinB